MSTDDASEPMVTMTFKQAQHLFDLAINTPLLCSGSFETDDVALLRQLAEWINVDPQEATPDSFVRDFPHPFVPFRLAGSHRMVPDPTLPVEMVFGVKCQGNRWETDEEVYARLGNNPDMCGAGVGDRRCNRPESDPMHVKRDLS